MLSHDEIAGVIAHELAHIKNRDTLLMTVTATVAGAISMLAQFGMFFRRSHRDGTSNSGMGVVGTLLIVVLAPIAAMIVQMAISRTREYAADNMGAQISGNPAALASALARIDSATHQIENVPAEQNPGDCASVYHQSAVRGAHGQFVLDSSSNRKSRCRFGATCRAVGSGAFRTLVQTDTSAAWTLGSTQSLGLSTAVRFRVNILIRFDSSYIRLPGSTPRLRPDVRFGSKADMIFRCGGYPLYLQSSR